MYIYIHIYSHIYFYYINQLLSAIRDLSQVVMFTKHSFTKVKEKKKL